MRRSIFAVILVLTAFTGAGAANAASDRPAAGAAPADPWERLNRRGYAINQFIDKILIRPVAMLYKALTPGPIGKGLHNVVVNLGEPLTFINDVLQGRPRRAAQAAGHFAFNSTLGLAGLIDVVARDGVAHHDSTFGDTLGRYGFGPGPYLFLPVIGPSTVRDLFGAGVDAVIDPVHWINYRYRTEISTSATVVSGLDTRAGADDQLKAILSDAADSYATLRSVYLQYRQGEIDGGRTGPILPPLPDIDDTTAPAPGASQTPAPGGAEMAPEATTPPSADDDEAKPNPLQATLLETPRQVAVVRAPFDQTVAFESLPSQ